MRAREPCLLGKVCKAKHVYFFMVFGSLIRRGLGSDNLPLATAGQPRACCEYEGAHKCRIQWSGKTCVEGMAVFKNNLDGRVWVQYLLPANIRVAKSVKYYLIVFQYQHRVNAFLIGKSPSSHTLLDCWMTQIFSLFREYPTFASRCEMALIVKIIMSYYE